MLDNENISKAPIVASLVANTTEHFCIKILAISLLKYGHTFIIDVIELLSNINNQSIIKYWIELSCDYTTLAFMWFECTENEAEPEGEE